MTRIDADFVDALSNVLREVRVLLSESQDSVWAVVAVSELLATIDKQIASLNATQMCRITDLKQIFAQRVPFKTLPPTMVGAANFSG